MVSQDKKKKNHDDPNSNWRYGGVARRDFRASKDGPEVIKQRRKRTKQDKKACKRSPDKKHDMRTFDVTPSYWPEQYGKWYVTKCEHCGKLKF